MATKRGWISNLGVVQTETIVVGTGTTSIAVSVKGRKDANYKVFACADYISADCYVTSKTSSGFTLNYTNPGATKNIDVMIVG